MRAILKIMLLCIALAMPPMAFADSAPREHIRLAQGGGKNLNEAVEQVRRQYKDGTIISAETKMKGDREVHHVRVMVNGKVKTVKVNGRTRG